MAWSCSGRVVFRRGIHRLVLAASGHRLGQFCSLEGVRARNGSEVVWRESLFHVKQFLAEALFALAKLENYQ
jgi:hypothetical protein